MGVAVVRGSTPAGRFLKQGTQTGMWYDIGDEMATEKTSQAFREKSKSKPKRESSDATASVTATATVVGDRTESLEGLTVTAAAASNSDNVTAEVAAAAAAVTKEAGNEVNVMAT